MVSVHEARGLINLPSPVYQRHKLSPEMHFTKINSNKPGDLRAQYVVPSVNTTAMKCHVRFQNILYYFRTAVRMFGKLFRSAKVLGHAWQHLSIYLVSPESAGKVYMNGKIRHSLPLL